MDRTSKLAIVVVNYAWQTTMQECRIRKFLVGIARIFYSNRTLVKERANLRSDFVYDLMLQFSEEREFHDDRADDE